MKFLKEDEVKKLVARTLGPDDRPVVPGPGQRSKRVSFEDVPDHSYVARAREALAEIGAFDWCVLWVVLTDVWPSNENLPLYYRVRQSYGNFDYVEDVPAVMALRHEVAAITSFLHLGMLFGWEMYAITSHDDGRLFVSHDGWYELSVAADQASAGASSGEHVWPAT